MWLVGILTLLLVTGSIIAFLARRERQIPNLQWDIGNLTAAYAGIVSDLAAFSVTAAVFLADIQTDMKQSLADVMTLFLISFIVLMGTTFTYTSFGGALGPEEMEEDFRVGRRMMYVCSTLGIYLGLTLGWLGLHPLLITVGLQEVADVFTWVLFFAVFAGASRLGAWLHTLVGVDALTTNLLPFVALASAVFYKLVLVPYYPVLWPPTHPTLSLSALVFAISTPVFALDTAMIARHGNQRAYALLVRIGDKCLPSYVACAVTCIFLLWLSVITQQVSDTPQTDVEKNSSGTAVSNGKAGPSS